MSTARPARERMAAYRERQRAAGLVHLTLVVPQQDVAFFTALAAQRRDQGPEPRSPEREPLPVTAKRAEELAQQLLREVMLQGWPIGKPLGSEAELMEAHGVSRPVLRQAISLLEHQGVVSMRRGAGGGLVVRQPDLAATLRAVSLYLQSRDIAPVAVLQTRRTLELAAVELAVARLDAAGEQALRTALEADRELHADSDPGDMQRLHEVLAALAGDPALQLFLQVVLRLTQLQVGFAQRAAPDRERVVERIQRLHRRIGEAVLARDAEQAKKLLARYLDGFRSWMGPIPTR